MKFSSALELIKAKINKHQNKGNIQPKMQNQFDDLLRHIKELRPDLKESFVLALLMDDKKYITYYQDVKDSGLSGVYHYYNYGYKEGRDFFEPNFRTITKAPLNTKGGSVIFFDTIKTNASFLYRGYFPQIRNNSAIILHQNSTIHEIIAAIFSAKEMIFIRPSNGSSKTKFYIKLCKALNVRVIIDMDDLLLPEFAELKGAIRSGISDYDQIFNDLTRDSSIFLAADQMVCSTQAIAKLHSELIKDIKVSRNRLPLEYFIERKAVEEKPINKKVKILYLSGSRTHLKDYSSISGPLLKLAQNHPEQFSLSFLGMLSDQTSIFTHLKVECNFLPLVEFSDMLSEIKKHDLVLVPLEKTVFNNAKSNIKFIEAASQGVAVIASAVTEYISCIENEKNGWVCDTESEWYDTLSHLIYNPEKIHSASLKAYDSAIEGYSV
ncbi:hypothetical protein [Pantoea sp.]|uniref:glycosyltransferase n=1 Tax=Pantoea sp. TaxID=69393 RepID=UPI0031DE6E4F